VHGGALVLGADYRALGIVRSLGRRGIPVWVLTQKGHVLAALSRYARRQLRWPESSPGKRIEFLLELAARNRLQGWALFPTEDATVTLVAQHHEALGDQYRVTVPPWRALRWVCNKRLLHRLARELEIDQPWTMCPRAREEVAALDCSFPLVLKPAMSGGNNPFGVVKAWRVEDRHALMIRYDEACRQVPPDAILIQEFVPGGGEAQVSYAALCCNGRPLASLTARRTRQYPTDFGRLSTYVETADVPGIVAPSERLLEAIGFSGLVEVEFKHDARNDTYRLLDVNPRVWGWHSLGARAGIDFPYLQWRMVHEQPVPEGKGCPGVCWMRMSTDVASALVEIVHKRLSIAEYVRSLRQPHESAVFATDDPIPGLLEIPSVAYLLGRRCFAGGTA
jgi:predicted ATP-grasp superfamily ATP-dependent carboligase